MGRGLLGDWEGKLSKLIALSTALAEKQMNGAMIVRAKAVIGSQQKREFRTKIGPDGARWPMNKDGTYPFPKGTTRDSAFAEIEGDTVRFGFRARVAKLFQDGIGRMHRTLIPDAERLGPVWGPRLLGALRQLLGQMARLKAVPQPSTAEDLS